MEPQVAGLKNGVCYDLLAADSQVKNGVCFD